MQIYHRFILVQDNATGLVSGVDSYPFRMAMHGLKRTDEPTHGCLVMSINPATGDMTIEDFPGEVTEAHIHRLMSKLDPLGQLDTGQNYAGFQIESIAGGRIFFNINDLPEHGNAMDEDAIWTAPVQEDPHNVGSGIGVGFRTPQGGGTGVGMGGIGAR